MSAEIPAEALQLRSLVRTDQVLELFLDMVPVSEPARPKGGRATLPFHRARGEAPGWQGPETR
jgi:hypothetical protein